MVAPRSHNLHFFKMIPVASNAELKELKLSKKVKETALLRTRRSKDTLWKVYVCRKEDSKWCFSGDNWREFVKFHDLNVHEFLVFEHKEKKYMSFWLTNICPLFNVFIYDSPTDGDGMICKKEFPPPTRGNHERKLILIADHQVTPTRLHQT
ncbi:hypothetical protein MKX03_028870 [Papaver bracteatum]|nr:hypothetical protein MKX03_028870 [Papaver bracteatum]